MSDALLKTTSWWSLKTFWWHRCFQLRLFSCYDLEYPRWQRITSVSFLRIWLNIKKQYIDFSIVVVSHCTSKMVGHYLSHPFSVYGWVNSDSDECCVLQLSTQLQKNEFKKRARATIMAVHQNLVSSVCHKEHRTFNAPFTHGRAQVYISLVLTNILKIRKFPWIRKFTSEQLNERFTDQFVLLVFHEWGPICLKWPA